MTAFKCDICGAYYQPYSYFGNQNNEKPNSLMTFVKRASGFQNDRVIERYDVRSERMKAVKKLFEERKRQGPSIGGD